MLSKCHWRKIVKVLLLLVIVIGLWPFEGRASYIMQFSNNLYKEGEVSFMVDRYLNQDDITYMMQGNLSVFGTLSDDLDFRVAAGVVYENNDMTMDDETQPYMTFDEVFQHTTQPYVDLREAFVSWRGRSLQVKVGLQFMDWGQIDGWNITDLPNSENLRRLAFSIYEEDRKIGLPAVSMIHHFKTLDIEAFYSPTWVPYRLPDINDAWLGNFADEFREITVSPEQLPSIFSTMGLPSIFMPIFSGGLPDGMTLPVTMHTRNPEPPEWFKDHQFGARIRKDIGYTTVGLLYFQGFDWFPSLEADFSLTLPRSLDINDLKNPGMDVVLYPVKRKIQMVGTEFSTTVKKVAIRGEAAYIKDRYYNKMLFDIDDLPQGLVDTRLIMSNFLESYARYPDAKTIDIPVPIETSALVKKTDELQVGMQAEYFYKGLAIANIFVYNHLFSPDPDVDLVMKENDLLALFAVGYPYLKQDMLIIGGGGSFLVAGGVIAMASVEKTWKDMIKTELGILSISGPDKSLLGVMDSNDEIFFKISYSF